MPSATCTSPSPTRWRASCDAIGVSAHGGDHRRQARLSAHQSRRCPGPVGGPCLEKDPLHPRRGPRAVRAQARDHAGRAPAQRARCPRRRPPPSRRPRPRCPAFPTRPVIALLGLAFKGRPATDDLRGTMARPILASLRRALPGGANGAASMPSSRRTHSPSSASRPARRWKRPSAARTSSSSPTTIRCFPQCRSKRCRRRMGEPALIYDFWNHFEPRNLRLPAGRAYMPLGNHGSTLGAAGRTHEPRTLSRDRRQRLSRRGAGAPARRATAPRCACSTTIGAATRAGSPTSPTASRW